ncbi:MAG: protease SohB, partial [Gammaproteobacteria bacterium]|nr:protease SohB [Gammaproteobacteria bacterium]
MDYLIEYAMFLAKAFTIVVAIGAVVMIVVMAAVKPKGQKGELSFDDLSQEHHDLVEDLQQEMLDKKAFKQWKKQQTAKSQTLPKLFVVDFHGSMDAHEVEALREEMTA